MLKIPTSESYLALNLSHAVSIVLYSLYSKKKFEPRTKKIIGKVEKDKLLEYFVKLLDEICYPEHKKEKTNIMFKRIIGRALPSKWEYHTLMGVFSRTIERIKR
jgi:tRNA C32,U32 (ribose-2'-O)-methylase TrmJ